MSEDVEHYKSAAQAWFMALQERIVAEFERLEDEAPGELYVGGGGVADVQAGGGAEVTGGGVLAGAGLAGADAAFVSLGVAPLAGGSTVGLLAPDAGAASWPPGDAASASPAVTWMDVAYRVLSRTS